jgi:cytochrome c oxidase assembly protein Cox11
MSANASTNHSWLPILIVMSLFALAMGLLVSLHKHVNIVWATMPGLSGLIAVSCFWLADLFFKSPDKKNIKNLYLGIAATLFTMFILWFAYLQVPLFHFVCHHFGIDGGVHNPAHQHDMMPVNYDQPLNLQLTTTSMRDFPVKVKVDKTKETWYPGGKYTMVVSFINESDKVVQVHPMLSATPERSTLSMHFLDHLPKKVTIKPHEYFQKKIDVIVHADFPKDIKSIAMLFHASDFTISQKPGQQKHWRELRTRYHPKRL